MYSDKFDSPFYPEDTDCEDCDQRMFEYDYEYEDINVDTLKDVYDNCIVPSVFETAKYLSPLLLASFIFNILTQIILIKKLPHYLFHLLSIVIGIYTVQHYVPECLYLLLIYAALSYACLCLPRRYQRGGEVFVISLLVILYCEYTMDPSAWHKVRSVMMIAAMKAVSVSLDKTNNNDFPNSYQYPGYLFGAATCLFGPWISFKDYIGLLDNERSSLSLEWIIQIIKHYTVSFIFLSISNCWGGWLLADSSTKWVLAYRDALSFRTSHYFISYASSSVLLLGGYPSSLTTIVKPGDIEMPRSLVQVVVSWNIPMHTWLKLYIFRPATKRIGKFSAVTLTYLTSALLHGLNFQLAAVLLSLGFYTYVEFQLRNILAHAFDACISAKRCPTEKCCHKKNSENCYWVIVANLSFSVLSIFHLAYLGLMFDTSDIQESGYSYSHTIDKWSQLGFASHWVALATYVIYFLLR
ncbi:protein-serine O-palmitoleoyltransferase porcupine [Diachasmimorpha longicaudata]|uniref:protein-serine O-palmitoleoyltransferase porcupine n=1 Tax=Diachasmimorpha longicaudata TaxID=58733 RepID=UPI0030B8776B